MLTKLPRFAGQLKVSSYYYSGYEDVRKKDLKQYVRFKDHVAGIVNQYQTAEVAKLPESVKITLEHTWNESFLFPAKHQDYLRIEMEDKHGERYRFYLDRDNGKKGLMAILRPKSPESFEAFIKRGIAVAKRISTRINAK
jgi:hypothetical protein